MAATSPTTARPAAAAPIRAPCPGLNRVSSPCCRRRHPHRAIPWWRPPRCSRKGKPVVTGVVEEEAPGVPDTQRKDGKEAEVSARPGALGWLRLDGVAADILSIAAPAVLALAADPITALVDTAFVGHIGSAELAAVGASASVFNLVSKLFNVPLLNVTTSFVAEQQAVDDNSNSTGENHPIVDGVYEIEGEPEVDPTAAELNLVAAQDPDQSPEGPKAGDQEDNGDGYDPVAALTWPGVLPDGWAVKWVPSESDSGRGN